MNLCPWLVGLFQEGELFSSTFSLTGLAPLIVWSLAGVAPRQVSTRAGRSPERTQRLPRPHGGHHPVAPRHRSSLLLLGSCASQFISSQKAMIFFLKLLMLFSSLSSDEGYSTSSSWPHGGFCRSVSRPFLKRGSEVGESVLFDFFGG